MPSLPGDSANRCSVLSVSPFPEDTDALTRLLRDYGWNIRSASTLFRARQSLARQLYPLLVCEANLSGGSWRDLLSETQSLPNPPFLIVTSRLADERLWAEALNLGAYDVLGKPFDELEVQRTLSMAWLHWNYRYGTRKPPLARSAGA